MMPQYGKLLSAPYPPVAAAALCYTLKCLAVRQQPHAILSMSPCMALCDNRPPVFPSLCHTPCAAPLCRQPTLLFPSACHLPTTIPQCCPMHVALPGLTPCAWLDPRATVYCGPWHPVPCFVPMCSLFAQCSLVRVQPSRPARLCVSALAPVACAFCPLWFSSLVDLLTAVSP